MSSHSCVLRCNGRVAVVESVSAPALSARPVGEDLDAAAASQAGSQSWSALMISPGPGAERQEDGGGRPNP